MEALPQLPDVRAVALSMLPIWRARWVGGWMGGGWVSVCDAPLAPRPPTAPHPSSHSFAGCELLTGVGGLVGSWHALQWLDLSGTGATDADLEAIAAGCSGLRTLNLNGCCRLKGTSLPALAQGLAVQRGRLVDVRLEDTPWVRADDLRALLDALSVCAAAPVHLALSHCGGVADASLLSLLLPLERMEADVQALAAAAAVAGGSQELAAASAALFAERASEATTTPAAFCLAELRLVGCRGVSDRALWQLARVRGGALLRGLTTLDLSHAESLREGRGRQPDALVKLQAGAGAEHSVGRDAMLSALLAAGGPTLRSLALDGAALNRGALLLVAASCTNLTHLSLVGCQGATSAEWQACSAALSELRSLAVGGPALSWREEHALTGA